MASPIPSGPKWQIVRTEAKNRYPLKISGLNEAQQQQVDAMIGKQHVGHQKTLQEHSVDYVFYSEEDLDKITAQLQKIWPQSSTPRSTSPSSSVDVISDEEITPDAVVVEQAPHEGELLFAYHALVRAIETFDEKNLKASEKDWSDVLAKLQGMGAYDPADKDRWATCIKNGNRSIRRRVELLGLLIPHLRHANLSAITNIENIKRVVQEKYETRKPRFGETLTDRLPSVLSALDQLAQWKIKPPVISTMEKIKSAKALVQRGIASNQALHERSIAETLTRDLAKIDAHHSISYQLEKDIPRCPNTFVTYQHVGEAQLTLSPVSAHLNTVKELCLQDGPVGLLNQCAFLAVTPGVLPDCMPAANVFGPALGLQDVIGQETQKAHYNIKRLSEEEIQIAADIQVEIKKLACSDIEDEISPYFTISLTTSFLYVIKRDKTTGVVTVKMEGVETVWDDPGIKDLSPLWQKKLLDVIGSVQKQYARQMLVSEVSFVRGPRPTMRIGCNPETQEMMESYLADNLEILSQEEFDKYLCLRGLCTSLIDAIVNFDPTKLPEAITTGIQQVERLFPGLFTDATKKAIQKCLKEGGRSIRRRFELLGLFLPALTPYLQRERSGFVSNLQTTHDALRAKYSQKTFESDRWSSIDRELQKIHEAVESRSRLDGMKVLVGMQKDATGISLQCATAEQGERLADTLAIPDAKRGLPPS